MKKSLKRKIFLELHNFVMNEEVSRVIPNKLTFCGTRSFVEQCTMTYPYTNKVITDTLFFKMLHFYPHKDVQHDFVKLLCYNIVTVPKYKYVKNIDYLQPKDRRLNPPHPMLTMSLYFLLIDSLDNTSRSIKESVRASYVMNLHV